MAIKEDVAHLANGAQVSYLDTGAPEGSTTYRTFIFIHGAAHNKCAWLVCKFSDVKSPGNPFSKSSRMVFEELLTPNEVTEARPR